MPLLVAVLSTAEGGNGAVPPKGVGEFPEPLDFGCNRLLEKLGNVDGTENWFAGEVVDVDGLILYLALALSTKSCSLPLYLSSRLGMLLTL